MVIKRTLREYRLNGYKISGTRIRS